MKVPHAYTPRTQPSERPLAYLQPASADLSGAARGMVLLGRTLTGLSAAIQAMDEEESKTWALKAASDAQLATAAQQETLQNNMQPGAKGLTQQTLEWYDKQIEATTAQAPSRKAAELFQQKMIPYRTQVGVASLNTEAKERLRLRITETADAIEKTGAAIYQAPPDQRETLYQQKWEEFRKDIDSFEMPPAQKQVLLQTMEEGFRKAAMRADATHRPAEAAAWAAGTASGKYYATLKSAESGGRNIRNASGPGGTPTSSAFGPYQFLYQTWEDTIVKKHPELGFTSRDRFNPKAQEVAIRVFTQDNAEYLKSKGVEVNDRNLYMAHFLGAAGAVRFLSGDPGSLAVNHVNEATANANRAVFYRDGKPRTVMEVYAFLTNKFGEGNTANFTRPVGAAPQTDETRPRPAYYDRATWQELDATYRASQAAINSELAEQRAALKTRVANALAESAVTGASSQVITEQDFAKVYQPNQAAQEYDAYAKNLRNATNVHSLREMSHSEIDSLVESEKPVAGSPTYADDVKRYGQLASAAAQAKMEFNKDMAGYVTQWSPQVKEAFAQVQQNPNAPAAWQNYVRQVDVELDRRGVLPGQRQLVPDKVIDSLAATIKAQEADPSKPNQIVQQVSAMAERFGEYWPEVYQRLAPKLTQVARVIGSGISPRAAGELAQHAGVTLDDIIKPLRDVEKKDLYDEVNRQLEGFTASLSGMRDATTTINDFREQLTKLVAIRMRNDGAASPTASTARSGVSVVQQAYEELIGFKYSFDTSDRMRVRIPKAANIEPANVRLGADQVMFRLGDMPLNMPTLDIGGLRPEYVREQFLADLQRRGVWRTNEDESGIFLTFNGAPVTQTDVMGQEHRVEFTWRDLSESLPATVFRRAEEEARRGRLPAGVPPVPSLLGEGQAPPEAPLPLPPPDQALPPLMGGP